MERGRYRFIIGQLYNELGLKDSASNAFDQVIALNRRIPRDYLINAHLQKINNIILTDSNQVEIHEYLTKMEEYWENRPFLDKIFYQKALYHMDLEQDSLGIVYFNKALRATKGDKKLAARSYERLANYYFDNSAYKTAGAYYDSVLPNLDEGTRKYRFIYKKAKNLEDVIKYEDIAQEADSIIALCSLDTKELEQYFQTYIDTLKVKDERRKKAKEREAAKELAALEASLAGQKTKGEWYFYNPKSLTFGKNTFKEKWGERKLADDWRWSDKTRIELTEDNFLAGASSGNSNKEEKVEEKYQVDFYMSQLVSQEKRDSLFLDRNFANYQLGLIYKEKFKEPELAASKLNKVLANDPQERLILPSKYNLYKIYEEIGHPDTEKVKQNIIVEHADSRYAALLLNPETEFRNTGDGPDALYSRLFQQYRNQEFLTVITKSQEYIDMFAGDPMSPKFEMLKALSIGRLQGYEPYKEALNYVALTYPNNAEGKKAEQMIKEDIPKLALREFSKDTVSEGTRNWKVMFPFTRSTDDNERAVALREKIDGVIKDLNYDRKVSKDIYNLEKQFVVVHGFKSQEFALGFVELIQTNKKYRIKDPNFVISSTNYEIIQVHKNYNDYLAQLVNP